MNFHDQPVAAFLAAHPEYAVIPPLLLRGLHEYLTMGIEPGGFLCAVLRNDLYRATGIADPQSLMNIGPLVSLVANYCPARSHRSEWGYRDDPVKAWCAARLRELDAEDAENNGDDDGVDLAALVPAGVKIAE